MEAALRRGVEDGPARAADLDPVLDHTGRVRDPERWRRLSPDRLISAINDEKLQSLMLDRSQWKETE